MRKKSCILMMMFLIVAAPCFASVFVKIRAVNPLDTKEVASIYYPLPKEITPEEVLSHKNIYSAKRSEEDIPEISEFQIVFNEEDRKYYVSQEIELMPKEVVTLVVEVDDVWKIKPSDVENLVKQAEEIIDFVDNDSSSVDETIILLKDAIVSSMKEIDQKQKMFTAEKTGVNKHIEAYRENLEMLEQIYLDISMIKTLIDGAKNEQ